LTELELPQIYIYWNA